MKIIKNSKIKYWIILTAYLYVFLITPSLHNHISIFIEEHKTCNGHITTSAPNEKNCPICIVNNFNTILLAAKINNNIPQEHKEKPIIYRTSKPSHQNIKQNNSRAPPISNI